MATCLQEPDTAQSFTQAEFEKGSPPRSRIWSLPCNKANVRASPYAGQLGFGVLS